jgi:putative transcriptional regulator
MTIMSYKKLTARIKFLSFSYLQKKIGQRIVELRVKLFWSQSDLARVCNKDRQAIEKLENGKVNPTLFTLLEVAQAHGVNSGYYYFLSLLLLRFTSKNL